MPDIPPPSAAASTAVAVEPVVAPRRSPPPKEPAPLRTPRRKLRSWWWLSFTPLAVLVGAVTGLLVRTHRAEIARALEPAAPVAQAAAPVTAATEGWRWLFTEDEWRGPAHGIGKFSDGLLEFHGSIAKPQTAPDAAIRARVVIRGASPPAASVFLRSTHSGQYRLVLDPAQRYVRLLDEVNGQQRELGKYRLAKPLAEGERVLLELRASGAEITGSLNGAVVVRARDTRTGDAGLWGIAGDGVWFETVEITDPKADRAVAQTAAPEAPAVEKPAAPAPLPVAAETAPTPAAVAPAPVVATAATPVPAPATPAPAAAAPTAEITNWLATFDAQWRASYQRDVLGPLEKGAAELRRQHILALESPLAAAVKAGRNEEGTAWRAERDQLLKGNNPPPADDDTTPPALRLLRANFRAQFARLDRERFDRASALFARSDDLLAKSKATLLGRQRAEDAVSVQKERDQLRQDWLQPPAVVATVLPPAIRPPVAPAKISSQQIVAKLMELNAAVWVKRGKTDNVELKSETEVGSDEKLVFTRVTFRARKRDESPLVTADFDILDSLSEVSELMLSGLAVKDSVIEKLRAFHGLKNLTYNDAKPSPASYSVLAALPELRDLQLINSDTTDEAMKSVVQCHKLQRLQLVGLPLTDAGMADLGKLGALEDLQMGELNKLDSPGFAHLADCRSLKRISANGFLILTGMVENLGHCKNLESLSLPRSGLKDAAIAPLGTLPKLRDLDLNGTAITGAAFATWPQRHELVSLNLANAGGVDDAGCKTIEHTFPKVQNLQFKVTAPAFSSEGASALARLRFLRSLRIDGDGIDDSVVAELAHCETLTTLGIAAAQLTDAGAASLAHLAHLNNLSLDYPPITDPAIKSFSRCKELKTVTIGKNADPNTESRFAKAVPGVSVVRPAG